MPCEDNNIEALSVCKEGHYFDRKSARIKPKDLAKTVVAFANAAGGQIAVGFENDGRVSGFSVDGATCIEEFEKINILECVPSPLVNISRVDTINVKREKDKILLLDVFPSPDVVIRRKSDNAVFLRQGDKSVQLGDREIRALEYDKNQRVFEDELVDDSSIDDIDHEILDRYKDALGVSCK